MRATTDGPAPRFADTFAHADAQHPARVAVIAEIGVNHDGRMDRARQLIAAAADAGADAVKCQYFDPDRLLSAQAELAGYQHGQATDVKALLAPLRLDLEQLHELKRSAGKHRVAFIVTPFSPEDVPELAALGVDALKVASPDAVNPLLLDAAQAVSRQRNVPVVVSTGTADLDELDHAAKVATENGGALLHCVSAYPTPMDAAHLGGVAALLERFGGRVGYSDHTPGLETGAWAVSAGACVLEKHLTHDRGAPGPDHAASIEPDELRRYIQRARDAAAALGPIAKTCGELEHDVRRVSRQSLAYRRDLAAGHVLTRGDLTTRRPGTGVPAAEVDAVVGQALSRAVVGGALIGPSDLR